MRKTLLKQKKIVIRIVTIIMVVLSTYLLNGCAVYEFYQYMTERNHLEEEQKKKEEKERILSEKLEMLYDEYTEPNQNKILEKEFDEFLERNFESTEHILKGLNGQKTYNANRYKEYLEKKAELYEYKDQLSREEFAKKEEEIWNKYNKSRNIIQEYLTQEEKQILEKCEEEINELYKRYL